MNAREWIKPMIDENVRLITTDRDLQIFMIGAFSLLTTIILYCTYIGDFSQSEIYFHAADLMLSGHFDYAELGTDLQPLTTLLLIPPRLVSPNPGIYQYMFSLYGFAFYMLGGHFMLKSCRETGFSQRDAYCLLFLFFLTAFSWMTLSMGPVAIALTIMSLWFYHIGKFNSALVILALATMAGYFPALLGLVYIIGFTEKHQFRDTLPGWTMFLGICLILLMFPQNITLDFSEFAAPPSLMGILHTWIGIDIHSTVLVAGTTFLAITLVVTGSVRIKSRLPEMHSSALLLEMGLILLVLLTPTYSPMQFIWIVMLFPMTQMTSPAFSGQKATYLILTAFCVMSLMCDTIMRNGESIADALSLIRFATLAILGIQLFREFKTIRD